MTQKNQQGEESASIFTEEQLSELGVVPCSSCNVMLGFIPAPWEYEGPRLHSVFCPKFNNSVVDFLAPDDEDEGVRWWNEQQRERRSEADDPFDKKWFTTEAKPVLIEIAASLRNFGSTDYERRNFKTKSDFQIYLYGLQKVLNEAAELSRSVRQKFADRHGEEFGEPKE